MLSRLAADAIKSKHPGISSIAATLLVLELKAPLAHVPLFAPIRLINRNDGWLSHTVRELQSSSIPLD
jgi:hypothetical protein